MICPFADNNGVLWCASCGCGDRCPVWVQLGLGLSVVSWGLGSTGDWGACPMRPGDHLHPE